MKIRMIVAFATFVFTGIMMFIAGCASAPYLDSSEAGNKPSDSPMPNVPAELVRKIETDMVKIPAGTLPAGYRTSRAHRTQKKDPEVKIRTFMMARHEVTQQEWTSVMGYNPSEDQSGPDLPVTNISWDEARQFIKRLNEAKGSEVFYLPSSVEWEYACRAGARGSVPMQAKEVTLSQYAWWEKNAGGRMHSVGKLKPNAWGLYDILGNVSEWLQDPYDPDTSQTVRFHAGAYFDDANLVGQDCRPGAGRSQNGKDAYTGMRVAKSADQAGKAKAVRK
jgi:formylglycine-generating enzyme required for sulfatase activity